MSGARVRGWQLPQHDREGRPSMCIVLLRRAPSRGSSCCPVPGGGLHGGGIEDENGQLWAGRSQKDVRIGSDM
jgi:hypothetical protein